MEVYFNNSFGNISVAEQNFLLQRLDQCRYDSDKQYPFVNENGTAADWIKKEGKVMSISTNGKDRHCKARFFAYYDVETDRMYISHFVTDHFSTKGRRKNDMYENNGVDGHIMNKINAHQAALNNHREPSANLGFVKSTGVSPQPYVYANITVDAVKEKLPHLSDIIYNNVDSLQEGFSTMLDNYKRDIYLCKYDETPENIQENRQAFRDMINDLVKDDNPTITKQKKQVIKLFIKNIYRSLRKNRNISGLDKEFIDEVVKEIDEAFKGEPAPLVDFSENRDQPNSDAEQSNRANQNGDQPNSDAEQPNRANQNGDQPNSDGRNTGNQTHRRLRTLSQNAWQNIDPNDPSKGIQKRVQNPEEARRMIGQYQRLGIKCRYNENTNSIEITDAESVQKLHELRTRNTTHGSRTTSRPTSVGIRSGGRQNNAARTNGSTPRRGRGRGRGNPIQTVINLVR